jgi:phospholipase/carboxylesterase
MDLAALVPAIDLPDYAFVFPNAPFPHPQVEGGRMWYDLAGNGEGLAESRQQLEEWLQSLEASTGVPLAKTVLAGFSQGGAMTLDVGLLLPLAGLIVLSGYLHPELRTLPNLPPSLVIHGSLDDVVPIVAAHRIRDQLTGLGATVQYHEFEMGHEIRPEVIKLMEQFILEQVPR